MVSIGVYSIRNLVLLMSRPEVVMNLSFLVAVLLQLDNQRIIRDFFTKPLSYVQIIFCMPKGRR